MIQKLLFRILMAPLALLYGTGVAIRNGLYSIGLLKEVSFNIPVISIGNLTVGGAGKTPHVEYLVTWLSEYIDVGVLSRGYKRKTRGFLSVGVHNTVEEVGDEPLQYKRKYPQVQVFVSESRVLGIPRIMAKHPQTKLVILDDAFQHRAVKPGLNILLTTYQDLFTGDYLLPMGRLREWRNAYKRADMVVVTKCPASLDAKMREEVIEKVKPQPYQQLFFSTYEYRLAYHLLYPSVTIRFSKNMHALVLSAIANTDFLLAHLETQLSSVKAIEYEDHHNFTRYEIAHVQKEFEQMEGEEKIIITTEKDAVRLSSHLSYIKEHEMPLFVLPVFVSFGEDESNFKGAVQDYLLSFKV